MPLTPELISYQNHPDSGFLNTYLHFFEHCKIAESDYLFLIKLAYEYKVHINHELNHFLNCLKALEENKAEHKLLWSILLSMYKKDYDISSVRHAFGDMIQRKYPIVDMFTDHKCLSYFENTKFRKEAVYYIAKWYTMFSSGYENLFCETCDSVLIPVFTAVDSYVCSNIKCSDKFVKYENHCWSCGAEINSKYNKQCGTCGWYICSECNSCAEGKPGGCDGQKPVANAEVRELKDFRVTFDECSIFKKIMFSNIRCYQKKNKENIRYANSLQIKRGTKILKTEDELIYYFISYGEMHYIKLLFNFSKVNFDELRGSRINIFDWGCGQGIGTLTLFDYMRQNQLKLDICEIFLIEPSEIAIRAAKNYLTNSLFNNYMAVKVNCINKRLDEDPGIRYNWSRAYNIHIFSNILDVDAFDLLKYSNMFIDMFPKNNLVFCVSPKYSKSEERISQFYKHIKKNIESTKLLAAHKECLKSDLINVVNNNKKNARYISNFSMIFKN